MASQSKRRPKNPPAIPQVFRLFLESEGLPLPVPELHFCETRKWRFDFAWPDYMVALEVEGTNIGKERGMLSGRHVSARGYHGDIGKYNVAQLLGWHVLRTTPSELATVSTAIMLKVALLNEPLTDKDLEVLRVRLETPWEEKPGSKNAAAWRKKIEDKGLKTNEK